MDNAEIVRLLLDAGATFKGPIYGYQRSETICCETELQAAALTGSADVLAVLLDRHPYIEELHAGQSKWVVLCDAVKGGHFAAAKLLLEAGAEVNASSNAISVHYNHRLIYLGEDVKPYRKFNFEELPSTPLLAAVETKNIEMVKLLVSYNANVNQVGFGTFGSTAVESAQHLEQWEVCSVLAQGGEGVAGATRMLFAVQHHDDEQIRLLVELGVNPACILDGDSKGHVNESMLLLFLGVCRGNVNATGLKTGRSPLQIAIYLQNIYVAQELVRNGANLDSPSCKPTFLLCAAVNTVAPFEAGDPLQAKVDLINLMIHKAEFADNQKELYYPWVGPLERAIQLGVLEIVKLFVEAGADRYTNPRRRPPLELALREAFRAKSHFQQRLMIVEYLLLTTNRIYDSPKMEKTGSDIWSDRLTYTIILEDHNAIYSILLRLLMEHYPYDNAPTRIRRNWEIVLQVAARVGDLSTVKLLLKFGVDVNAPPQDSSYTDGCDLTALQAAVYGGHMDTVLELIKYGAEINAAAAEEDGRTAVQAAAAEGDTEMVLMLLERGADIEAPPARTWGITALQGAVYHGNIKLVSLLLERGANVNAPGSEVEGMIALEVAARWGRLDITQLLLNAGAESLETAKDLAIEADHFVIVELLDNEIRKRDMGHVNE
jgi:ankyrin repeat protein